MHPQESVFMYVAAEGANGAKESQFGPPTMPFVAALQAALDNVQSEGRIDTRVRVVQMSTREFLLTLAHTKADDSKPFVVWPYYRSKPPGTPEDPDAFSGMSDLPSNFVINDARKEGVRLGDKGFDYKRAEEYNIPIPRTVLLGDVEGINEELGFEYPLVIKGYPSGRGMDVHLCESVEAARAAYEKCKEKGLNVVAQEYIKYSHGRDLRVLVVGKEIVLMLGREAAPGEFKSNVSRGGRYISNPKISDEDMDLIRKVIETFPLDVAGIDFLYTENGLVFNEINSAPGWSGLAESMTVALAKLIHSRLMNVLDSSA